eukprot:1159146-Pelagomonas_calceolata.AAC.10
MNLWLRGHNSGSWALDNGKNKDNCRLLRGMDRPLKAVMPIQVGMHRRQQGHDACTGQRHCGMHMTLQGRDACTGQRHCGMHMTLQGCDACTGEHAQTSARL